MNFKRVISKQKTKFFKYNNHPSYKYIKTIEVNFHTKLRMRRIFLLLAEPAILKPALKDFKTNFF